MLRRSKKWHDTMRTSGTVTRLHFFVSKKERKNKQITAINEFMNVLISSLFASKVSFDCWR